MTTQCTPLVGKILFRLGQMLLVVGIVCFVVALSTEDWVIRPTVDYIKEGLHPNQTLVTKNFGIFVACRQQQSSNTAEDGGNCGSLWQNINFINSHTARYIQCVMVVAAILYGLSLLMEIIQCLPIQRYRNFVAKNRMVEMFASIATVLSLKGMVIFAGEIKNKAERVPGQEDEESGWSFTVGLIGLILCTVGIVLVTMFRELPVLGPDKIGGTWLRDPITKPHTSNLGH